MLVECGSLVEVGLSSADKKANSRRPLSKSTHFRLMSSKGAQFGPRPTPTGFGPIWPKAARAHANLTRVVGSTFEIKSTGILTAPRCPRGAWDILNS